jgi:hypothetical protein
MNTPKLKLPLLTTHQAQKEVTHNEALTKLECFVQTIVLSRTTMPNNPAEGDTVIVKEQLAYYLNGAWEYYDLFDGFECWVKDEQIKLVYWDNEWHQIFLLTMN